MSRKVVTLSLALGVGAAIAISAGAGARSAPGVPEPGRQAAEPADPQRATPPSPLTVEVEATADDARQAPISFAADLALAHEATNVAIGAPCEEGNENWRFESASVLAPVAGTSAEGHCVIIGWSYIDGRLMDFDLPQDEHGYVQQPIFDESGHLTAFFLGGEPTELPNGPGGDQ